jgi:hypothetical protein
MRKQPTIVSSAPFIGFSPQWAEVTIMVKSEQIPNLPNIHAIMDFPDC